MSDRDSACAGPILGGTGIGGDASNGGGGATPPS